MAKPAATPEEETKAEDKAPETPEAPQIHIAKIASETLFIPIIGTTPLIMSRFSEKAKRKMLDAQQGRRTPKEIRNPEEEYEASMYRLGEGYGFPAVAFKSATVAAARFYGKDVKMTELRQFLWFTGEMADNTDQPLVPINGGPKMREDYVRLAGASRSADLRYRAEFWPWDAVLKVTYVSSCLSRESVLSLIDAGGMGVGVGEWRPERKGDFGTYSIDETKDIDIERGEK